MCEPLIQGAGGMRICRPQFLQAVIKLVKSYGILVIFDEVMTGFGRTGKNFAHQHLSSDCEPDIICLSKGITGGFLPMGLTITQQRIYDEFYDDSFDKALAHGHSYTANPISCAAACAAEIDGLWTRHG